ncbi:hypothetical protein ACHQM5_003345 [Ranunculus cassubicifolius]
MRIRRNQTSLDSDSSSSSSRSLRRKQKSLDAICEEEYTRNRNRRVVEAESNLLENEEIRRSSRVRRAPVLLDVSPQPAKKRRRIGNDGGSSSSRKKVEEGSGGGTSSPGLSSGSVERGGGGGWKLRLRSTVHNASVESKEKIDSPVRKRKLFDEVDVFIGKNKNKGKKIDDNVDESEDAKSSNDKSERSGSGDDKKLEGKEIGDNASGVSVSDDDKNDGGLVDGALSLDKEDNLHAESVMGGNCDMVVADDSLTQISEKQDSKIVDGVFDDDQQNSSRHIETTDQCDKRIEHVECENEGVDSMEVAGHSPEKLHDGGSPTGKNDGSCDVGRKHLEDMKFEVDKSKQSSPDMVGKKHIREGRRCGLCGRGTDGKPPKRLAADPTDSDNDAYGGSSSCEEGNYSVLDGFTDEPGWLGRLLGPIHDRFGIADVWVHQHCAVWSPEVYFAGLGCLKNVRAALSRGKALKCSRCGRPGATIGCRVDRCPKTYHLPCGRAVGCIFDHRKFLIACNDHRHLFEPHNNSNMQRLKRLKTKKLKLETRKLSHDAWKKDIEAEEKWLENCGEDEEFLKREGKRLHRDILRIAPVYIGGSATENEKQYQGWESVAGLQDVIKCMKEVVLLPLLYPEFYSSMGITPPRGILLHGYPGTGKTHVVRALIGSCARGDRKIAYFARKGADCLGKYVGDAERQLRLLFQVAERSQPSIIFFDEIDGLAPCRTRQQDQTHNSVVSTLLALMDGLKSRGSVIVIGATNRPDAVDSALRRPGRFDREIYFPLPSVKDRAAILSLHTQRWPKPISGSLLKWISQRTSGFAGADLQALCTQAAMIALKKNCPLPELMLTAEKKANSGIHLSLPSCVVEETDWLDALACAPPPCSRREAGMAANDVASSPLQTHLVPCLLQPLSYLLVSLYLDERVWLPPLLYKAAKLIKAVIVSSLGQREKSTDLWWSCLPDLVKEADIAVQIEETLSCAGLFVSGSSFSNRNMLPDKHDAANELELCKESSARGISLPNISCLVRQSGFRVLITGHPKSGQRHIASCFLHGFVGCVEIQKVDLATISQEGHGNIADGMNNILLKCSSKGLCVLYMPRIDLWAIDTHHQPDSSDDDSCANTDAKLSTSRIWSSFMEQVDAIRLSASLMILATSEVPSEDLPHKISQFFASNTFKPNDSTTSEQSMPRFVVQLDGSFDYDALMNSSASQLSRDLVQQYVQFLHHRAHASVKINKNTAADVIENDVEFESHKTLSEKSTERTTPILARTITDSDGTGLGSNTQQHSDDQCPTTLKSIENKDAAVEICHSQDTVPRGLCNNKTAKGKSSMLLAISSLGYQILQYPHFAELCWTTSKLKEGPCADINGPWKGWPFNSCIVRPNDSSEKVILGHSSSNHKNKENFGVVRGLVAVGLLAYKGVYTSIREVSFEVRKVLELLVEQLNAKILDGKDRAQFFYLLSQVAYLEDMVNSWAYTLQSLECDASTLAKSSEVKSDQCRDNQRASECNAIETDVCKPNIKKKSSDETEVLEQSEFVGLNEGISCRDELDFEGRITPSEVSAQGMTSSTHPSPRSPPQNSISAGDLLDSSKALDTQSTITNAGPKSGKFIEVIRGSVSFSQTSNSTPMEKSFLISSIEMEKSVISSDVNAQKFEELVENPNTKNKDDVVSVSHVSRLTCLYSCCFNCMNLIYALVRKILTSEWKAIKNSWTVEDANEAICSWSTNFLSSFGKSYAVESDRKSELSSENTGLCTCSDVDHKGANGNSRLGSRAVLPAECNFHSTSKDVTENTNVSTNSHFGVALKFCFMDNVLIASDLDKDVSTHCKFQNLCLNSLIEWILMIKQPLS